MQRLCIVYSGFYLFFFFPNLGSGNETLVRCCGHSPSTSHQHSHREDLCDGAEPQGPRLEGGLKETVPSMGLSLKQTQNTSSKTAFPHPSTRKAWLVTNMQGIRAPVFNLPVIVRISQMIFLISTKSRLNSYFRPFCGTRGPSSVSLRMHEGPPAPLSLKQIVSYLPMLSKNAQDGTGPFWLDPTKSQLWPSEGAVGGEGKAAPSSVQLW